MRAPDHLFCEFNFCETEMMSDKLQSMDIRDKPVCRNTCRTIQGSLTTNAGTWFLAGEEHCILYSQQLAILNCLHFSFSLHHEMKCKLCANPTFSMSRHYRFKVSCYLPTVHTRFPLSVDIDVLLLVWHTESLALKRFQKIWKWQKLNALLGRSIRNLADQKFIQINLYLYYLLLTIY